MNTFWLRTQQVYLLMMVIHGASGIIYLCFTGNDSLIASVCGVVHVLMIPCSLFVALISFSNPIFLMGPLLFMFTLVLIFISEGESDINGSPARMIIEVGFLVTAFVFLRILPNAASKSLDAKSKFDSRL